MLCHKHNQALRPYDRAGNAFFEAVAGALDGETFDREIDGDDLERWCLKATVGTLASGDHAVHKQTGAAFSAAPSMNALRILFDGEEMPEGTGLHFVKDNPPADNAELLFLLPLFGPGHGDDREVCGVFARCYGLQLLTTWSTLARVPTTASFRPGALRLQEASWVRFRWRGPCRPTAGLAFAIHSYKP